MIELDSFICVYVYKIFRILFLKFIFFKWDDVEKWLLCGDMFVKMMIMIICSISGFLLV